MSKASGGRGGKAAPPPPEKGVFPLDHFHECAAAKETYLECVKGAATAHEPCAALSKAYLDCRMRKGLMKPQPLTELGFAESYDARDQAEKAARAREAAEAAKREREGAGFIAGARRPTR